MKTRLWLTAAAGALAIGGAAFAETPSKTGAPAPPVDEAQALANGSTATPHYGAWGFDLAGMDKAIKPGNNFYDYADGDAIAALKIPADLSGWGAFTILSELSENRVKLIVEEAAATAPLAPTTSDAKVGAFFKAFMDEKRVEQLGAAPLKPELDAVRAVTSKDDSPP